MLQKTQWSLAATALAVGAWLAAPPAQAQVRHHLSRGGVTTIYTGGIVTPPSAPATGIVIPPSAPLSAPAVTPTPPPAPAPAPAPVVSPPPPALTATPIVGPPAFGFFGGGPTPAPSLQTAPQGFSAGPSLLGDMRLPLGHLVDRVGPAIIGDSGPTVQKVIAHH